jgi:hypothetical protein
MASWPPLSHFVFAISAIRQAPVATASKRLLWVRERSQSGAIDASIEIVNQNSIIQNSIIWNLI